MYKLYVWWVMSIPSLQEMSQIKLKYTNVETTKMGHLPHMHEITEHISQYCIKPSTPFKMKVIVYSTN